MSELSIPEAMRLALGHQNAGRFAEAEQIYRKIIDVQPSHADALQLLGLTHFQTNRPGPALELIQRAIQLRPNAAIYHNNCGQVLERLQRARDAAAEYRLAIGLDPKYAAPRNNLANILEREDKLNEAIQGYGEAIELNPNYGEAYANLGNAYKELGDLEQAIVHYRRAVQIQPAAYSNLLFALHYQSGGSPAALAAEHRAWRESRADPLRAEWRLHPNLRDPNRRLRIGYVSPDFRHHPVARFMLPLLQNHDRAQFEIFGYSDALIPDELTARVKKQTDQWRDIAALDDVQLVELVRRDQIDILVDLAAHTSRTRILAFARKAAPVQVSYLAYCSTTGLDAIDYRISDPYFDPPDTDLSHYAEQTIRLPATYWCYSAPDNGPEPGPLPLQQSGIVTFGCLNNFCKVTDETLRLWARLLHAVPRGRLLLHARNGPHRQRVLDALRKAGEPAERVKFVGAQTFGAYLGSYREIDIGLDPVPFNGGTTTCDALWMGVPVVTRTGETAVSRAGSSILSNVGLPELIAHTDEEYVRIAAGLAADGPRLADLRSTLRQRLRASRLMDAPPFARDMESVFRFAWRNWCERMPA